MKDQHIGNHMRFSPLYHFFTAPLALTALVLAVINVARSWPMAVLQPVLILLIVILGALAVLHARMFALRAQDRAIRAEESLRHFVLTGKPFVKQLRMGQVIALRFASDAELPELAARAASEHLSNRQIKEAIKDWRPDHYRV